MSKQRGRYAVAVRHEDGTVQRSYHEDRDLALDLAAEVNAWNDGLTAWVEDAQTGRKIGGVR